MGMKGDMRVNLNLPKLDLTKEMLKIGEKVIIPDIQGRINSGKDIDNRSYRANASSTTRYKQKKGLRTETLLATGQLRKSFQAGIIGKNRVLVVPAGMRRSHFGERVISNKELVDILQNQGVRAKAGRRHFKLFGVSDKAEGKSLILMEKFIGEAIDRGGRKLIR